MGTKNLKIKSLISHVEFNVINYKNSVLFYDIVLPPIGFTRINCIKEYTAFTDGLSKIILAPTQDKFKESGFHRQKPGLNHLAFYADSKEQVDGYCENVLIKNDIKPLYDGKPSGDDDYYAVFFEDPDRLKLELVYAPKYCDPNCWPNTLENDFDPYHKNLVEL